MLDTFWRYEDLTDTSSTDDSLEALGFDTEFVAAPLNQGEELELDSDTSEVVPPDKLPTFDDSLELLRSNISQYALLKPAEEQLLGKQIWQVRIDIVVAILSYKVSANDFITVIHHLLEHPLSRAILFDKKQYFIYKQELQTLTASTTNREQLIDLLQVVESFWSQAKPTSQSEQLPNTENFHGMLCEKVKSIQWPIALLVALTKRYMPTTKAVSLLDNALLRLYKHCHLPERLSLEQADAGLSRQLVRLTTDYYRVRDALVIHNIPLVVNIAKRYSSRKEDLTELIQEGILGLMRAAEKYRVASGNRFSTYAYGWIDSKVRAAKINVQSVMPISPDLNKQLYRLYSAIEHLRDEGLAVSVENLATQMNISEEQVRYLTRINRNHLSLDHVYSDHANTSLHALIGDPSPSIAERVITTRRNHQLREVLANVLTEREAYLISERFGLLDAKPKPIRMVADILGISRERVRQLEEGSLNKLRDYFDNSFEGNGLVEFFDVEH